MDSPILALSHVNLAGKGSESQINTNIPVTAQKRCYDMGDWHCAKIRSFPTDSEDGAGLCGGMEVQLQPSPIYKS